MLESQITNGDAEAAGKKTMEDVKALASDLSALPSNDKEVMVSDTIRNLIKVPQLVYIGTGDLSHDRAVLSNLIDTTSKDGVLSLITKRFNLYEPAASLEGGTGVVDLPGTNTLGATEIMHTRKGVEDAGVIFVVLRTNLDGDANSVEAMKNSGVMKRVLRERFASNPVVFLFNREMRCLGDPSALEDKLGSDEEKQIQACWNHIFAKHRTLQLAYSPKLTDHLISKVIIIRLFRRFTLSRALGRPGRAS